MSNQDVFKEVDRKIRIVREMSEQRADVSEEHLNDLIKKLDVGKEGKLEDLQSRFQKTISTIIKLEAEYSQKIKHLEQALDKTTVPIKEEKSSD